MTSLSVKTSAPRAEIAALVALLLGAVTMGISPVFVRWAEVGPLTSAFWRVFLALPLLWAWARMERGSGKPQGGWSPAQVICGILFAGDLFFWHLAIFNTTIANATLLATMAPAWVMLGSGLILGEKATRAMWFGLLICIAGAASLVGASFNLADGHFLGDAFGVLTSFFFGCYFLSTRFARRSVGPGTLMFRSSIVTAACLLLVALAREDQFFPHTWEGIAALCVISLLSHAVGQGLLAFALGRLNAGFSALVIFLEAVTAAGFAWIAVGERLSIWQGLGGMMIFVGIWMARPKAESRMPVVEKGGEV